jgi:DNA invertase Pin-like site-specific DNA recombinase
MEHMTKAVLYARVSSDRQKQEQTIESQVAELKRQIATAGHTLVKEYVDDGYSGAYLDRPALDQLRLDVKVDAFDVVYFLCADRIARDMIHQTIIVGEFLRYKKRIIINGKDYEENPENRFTLQVLGAVAQFERAKIIERTRRGALHHVRAGKLISQGHTTFGYRYMRKTTERAAHLLIDEEQAAVVRSVFEMFAYCSARRYFKFVRPSGNISVYHRAAYRCTRRLNDYAHDPAVVAPCHNSMVSTHILDAKIVGLIRDTLLDPEKLRSCIEGESNLPQDEGREAEWIAAELRQLDEDRRQLTKLYATGKMSKGQYVGASRAIDEMLERFKSERELAVRTKRGAIPNTVSMSRLRQFCATARSRFEGCADFEAKRRFLREYVGRIVFHKGTVAVIGSIPAHGVTSEPTVQYRIGGRIDRSKVRLKESRMLWQDERLTSWVPENVAV